MRARPFLSTVALGLIARSVDAQADVARIVDASGAARTVTSDVLLTRFGAVAAGSLQLSAKLKAGDELRSVKGSTRVVLQCLSSAEVILEGQFRAVIMRGRPGKSCFVDLLAGKAHVTGDTTTGLGLGDATLGAKGTRYTVTVTTPDDTVQSNVEVFDGEVELERAAAPRPISVMAGKWLPLEGAIQSERLSPKRIRAAAEIYARIDASKVDSARRPAAAESLTVRYEEVLANPDSSGARLRLVEKQIQLNAIGNNTMYELKRARATVSRGSDVEAATAALSLAAYVQLGRNDLISSQLTTLRSIDARMAERALRHVDTLLTEIAPRLNPAALDSVRGPLRELLRERAVPRDTLRVRVNGPRDTLRAGQRTDITVTVRGRLGVIAGAVVSIQAGGGVFPSGGTRVTGTTNSDGIFATRWTCTTCAPSYLLNVEATRAGFHAGRATLTIRVK